MNKTVNPMTATTASRFAMPSGIGHASDAIQGRIAVSGVVLGGLDVRDRDAAARTTLGFAATTVPGPDAWSPPTG